MKLILQIIQSVAAFLKKILETLITFAKIIIKNDYWFKNSKFPAADYILLANGPTLKKDLEKLNTYIINNPIVVVNQFATTDYYTELKPSYYVLLDHAYFRTGHNIKIAFVNIEAILSKTTWPITILIPSQYKNSNFAKRSKENSNINLKFINQTVAKGGFDIINYALFNNNLAMAQSQNVVIGALFALIKNNVQSIYMFGVQNNWHTVTIVGQDNNLYQDDKHFYKENNTTRQLFMNIEETIPMKIADQLRILTKVFEGYTNLEKYAQYKKCSIYNCSKDSYVDAFTRLTDEEFINNVTKKNSN